MDPGLFTPEPWAPPPQLSPRTLFPVFNFWMPEQYLGLHQPPCLWPPPSTSLTLCWPFPALFSLSPAFLPSGQHSSEFSRAHFLPWALLLHLLHSHLSGCHQGVDDTKQSPSKPWLFTQRANLPDSLPRMAHSQLKCSTSKTNPLTSSPKPVPSFLVPWTSLSRIPSCNQELSRTYACPSSLWQQVPGPADLANGMAVPHPLVLFPLHILGALLASDLDDRNSLWVPPPSQPTPPGSSRFKSTAGFTSRAPAQITWGGVGEAI